MKYHSPNTDLAALQRELTGSRPSADDDFDEYAEYVDDEDDEDDPSIDAIDARGNWADGQR